MNYDNAAARLHALLKRGKEFKTDLRCRDCWVELLGKPSDNAVLMTRLGLAMALPAQAITEIQLSFPSHPPTWKHWEAQVSAAFMVQNLHAEWGTFINNVDEHTLLYLSMSAELLNARAAAQRLDDTKLHEVREKVQSALTDALAANLPPALKAQVVRCLKKVLDALDTYAITGAVGIVEAAEAALGHGSLDSEYKSFLTDDAVGQRALDAIAAAANLMTFALGLPQLSIAVTALLK